MPRWWRRGKMSDGCWLRREACLLSWRVYWIFGVADFKMPNVEYWRIDSFYCRGLLCFYLVSLPCPFPLRKVLGCRVYACCWHLLWWPFYTWLWLVYWVVRLLDTWWEAVKHGNWLKCHKWRWILRNSWRKDAEEQVVFNINCMLFVSVHCRTWLRSSLQFEFIIKVLDLEGQTMGRKLKEIIIGRSCPNDRSQNQLYSVCCNVKCTHGFPTEL